MINLLLGAPGGGKSYEAVVFHILPALAKGRKVITNLPLDLERIADIDSSYPALIEKRMSTKAERPEVDWEKAQNLFQKFGIAHRSKQHNPAAFSSREDYGDEWRHPETGSGPLYVIDECHIALPRSSTPIAVEEWFSLHRHESADVLLITQSYGKVNRAVIDLVQVVYRVRKNVAFGSSKTYVRKVQDGIRGDVVNTSIREYKKQFFALYKSHTRGGGSELQAVDIVPFWRRWPVVGAVLMLPISTAAFWYAGGVNPMKATESTKVVKVGDPKPANFVPADVQPGQRPNNPQPQEKEPQPKEVEHPLKGYGIHVMGRVVFAGRTLYRFAISQNGQRIFSMDGEELQRLGYKLALLEPCVVGISNGKFSGVAVCDAPAIQIGPPTAADAGGSPLAGGTRDQSPPPPRPVT